MTQRITCAVNGGASVVSPDSIGIRHDFHSTLSPSCLLLPDGGRPTVIGGAMLPVVGPGTPLAYRTRFGLFLCAPGDDFLCAPGDDFLCAPGDDFLCAPGDDFLCAPGDDGISAALTGVPVAMTTILVCTLSSRLARLSPGSASALSRLRRGGFCSAAISAPRMTPSTAA